MKLEKWLKANHVSQKWLSVKLNITPVAVCHYVNGHRIPRPSIMQQISYITQGRVTANDFYTNEKLSVIYPHESTLCNKNVSKASALHPTE